MAVSKKNAAKVNSENMVKLEQDAQKEIQAQVASDTLEQTLERLAALDKVYNAEKQDMLSVFIEKAANVLANEKNVQRLNVCYAKLCKLNDKKLARAFVNAFTVLSSEWARQGKKLVALLDTNTVKFSTDGKLKLMQCTDVAKFAESWIYHRQAIKFNQTNVLSYVSGVKIEKASSDNDLDATKKAIAALYKKGNLESRKFLADFMREKGIEIPTF